VTVPGSETLTFGRARDAERDEEVLAHTERSRVCRHFLPGGSIICKQLFGANTARRARRETAILERLDSVPGVVKLNSETHDADSIALEDVAGGPLSEVLRGERLGIAALLDLALDLTETVGAMHRLGVVHRDINPSNILVAGQEGRPVLIDFGIASSSADERPAFTAHAEIEGTLAYIAPEQTGRTGRVMDQRADLYSLGVTLYELATGHRPFESDDPFQVIRDHLVRVATPPVTLQPDVPQVLSDIIMRLLQKEPDRRYQSAEGLAADLTRLIKDRAAGKTQPFLLGERDFPRRLLAPSRLIGREAEIVALHAAFDDAVEGRNNGLLVSGSPGIGKTVLINELRAIVTAKRGLFVMGKFDRYRQDMEADAVLQALRGMFRLLLAEPEEDLVPLRASLLRVLGSGANRQAAALIPELGALLKIVPDGVHDVAPPNQGRLAQTALDMLKCVASKLRPVVFVVDDLQWAPATPLGFLDAVMSGARSAGLLLVGAYRKEEVDSAHPLSALLSRWDRLSSPPRRLLLNNLPANDLRDLLQEMLHLGPGQAAKLADAVASRTRGNDTDSELRCETAPRPEVIDSCSHEQLGLQRHGR
jgi:predicted Ser/Thr protein kinase